jgi:tetratricopeptide (TPR) repeat protein
MLLGLAHLAKKNTTEAVKQFEQREQAQSRPGPEPLLPRARSPCPGQCGGSAPGLPAGAEARPRQKQVSHRAGWPCRARTPGRRGPGRHIADLKRAVERDPQNVPARYSLAQAQVAAGQRQEAEVELKRILEINPRFVAANMTLAGLFILGNKPDAAAEYLKAVLRVEPGHLDANRLHRPATNQRLSASAEPPSSISRSSPRPFLNAPTSTCSSPSSTARSGVYEDGIELTKVGRGRPAKYAPAYILAGRDADGLGRPAPQAIEALTTATRLDPKLALGHFSSRPRSGEEGNLEAALSSYRQAQALNPRDPRAYNNVAWVLASQART